MTASRTSSARRARLLKFKSVAITHWPTLTYLKPRDVSIHDHISRHDRGSSVGNQCYMRGEFTENHGKVRAKLVVNRDDIRRKFAENHRKLRGASAENRGKARSVVLKRTFPFWLCEMIISSVHLFKRSVGSLFKKFDE
jgi:hypothetical protein